MPIRIQRSRAKGARLPDNTVCVDRSTKWGNPFVVGEHGSRAECVDLFSKLLAGYVCVSDGPEANLQLAYRAMVAACRHELKGKNLACWCPLVDKNGKRVPCHADMLLELANTPAGKSGVGGKSVD